MDADIELWVTYADGRRRFSVLRVVTLEESLQGDYRPVSDIWWASLEETYRQSLLKGLSFSESDVLLYAHRPTYDGQEEDVWLDARSLFHRYTLDTMVAGELDLKAHCLCFVPKRATRHWYHSVPFEKGEVCDWSVYHRRRG